MPASGRSLLAGCIGGMLRLKCDEEIIHNLTQVYDAWSFFLDHNDDALRKVDAHTVECLESRIPARSLSDEKVLRPLVEEGSIFGSFTPSEREHIWRNLKLYPRRVPSIRLFLKDLLYLETLVDCVKKLVQPGRRQTVFQAFRQSFVGAELQQSVSTDDSVEEPHFEKSYRELFLFAMRQLEPLRPGSVLLEKGEARQAVEKDPRAWYNFAHEAYRLGFRSSSITDILSHNPDRAVARSTLLRARNPAVFEYDEPEFESFVNQMMTMFNHARRLDPLDEVPSLVCDGNGEEVKRRSGRPFRKAFEESAKFLTFDNMHMRDTDDAGELTPFFIRRDVYLSFFGSIDGTDHSSSEAMSMSPPSPAEPDPELETSDNIHTGLEVVVRRDELSEDAIASDDHPITGSRGLEDSPGRLPHSPISSSQYSQSSEDPRVGTGIPHLIENADWWRQDMTPKAGGSALDPSLNHSTIQFISLGGSRPEVVEEMVISTTTDPVVEAVAGRYASRGMFLFNRQLRSVAPPQCLEVALEDEERAVFVIPETRSTFSAASLLESSGLKRPASEEMISNRPRKMYIV